LRNNQPVTGKRYTVKLHQFVPWLSLTSPSRGEDGKQHHFK